MRGKDDKPESGYELALMVAALQADSDDYRDFAQEVLFLCAMPDVERYVLEGRFEGHIAEDAIGALLKLLRNHRRILEFLKNNRIDVDKVLSGSSDEKLMS